jgi:hypothetical protein
MLAFRGIARIDRNRPLNGHDSQIGRSTEATRRCIAQCRITAFSKDQRFSRGRGDKARQRTESSILSASELRFDRRVMRRRSRSTGTLNYPRLGYALERESVPAPASVLRGL